MTEEILTPEEMRSMGYAANAVPTLLSPAAFAAKCAWLGCEDQNLVPKHFRFSDQISAAAWERVVLAVKRSKALEPK